MRSEATPDGLFVFQAFNYDVVRLQSEITPETGFDTFMDKVVEQFWTVLEYTLGHVRHYIEHDFIAGVHVLTDEMEKDVVRELASANLSPLRDAIAAARTQMSVNVANVASWFTLARDMERPDYEFGIAVEVAIESIRVCHPSLDVTLQRADGISFDCRGKTLESLVYMLFTALDNALEHCGFSDHAPALKLETSLQESWLELRLVNSCAPIASVEGENTRLAELRERLESGNEAQGLATIEGGSGYAKIIRILRHDLLARHSLEFGSWPHRICRDDRHGRKGDGEMRALIVEDDELKTERLRSFLIQELPKHQIEVTRSYKSGLRALVAEAWALVILDMTLPTFDILPGSDGGRPLSLGGRELLRQMKRRSLGYPTAVVTGFDAFGSEPEAVTLAQLDGELKQEFGDFYIGSIYFNATTDDWRDQLRLLIQAGACGS